MKLNQIKLSIWNLIFISIILIPVFLNAQQQTIVKFYKDIKLEVETSEKKGKYKTLTCKEADMKIVELVRAKDEKILWHKSFFNNKPYGEWYSMNSMGQKINIINYGSYLPEGAIVYDIENQMISNSTKGEFVKPEIIIEDEQVRLNADKFKTSYLNAWLSMNLKYPYEAQMKGIQDTVLTQFTIEPNGEIKNIRIINKNHNILDKECFRLLNNVPKMKPATLNGQPIQLYVAVPFNFILQWAVVK